MFGSRIGVVYWLAAAAVMVVLFNFWPDLANSAWLLPGVVAVSVAFAVGLYWVMKRRSGGAPPPP